MYFLCLFTFPIILSARGKPSLLSSNGMGFISMEMRFGGSATFNTFYPYEHQALGGMILSVYPEDRSKYRVPYSALIQIRINGALISSRSERLLNQFNGGFLFGGSIEAVRSGIYSLWVDGGMTFDIGTGNHLYQLYYPFIMETEITLKNIIRVHKQVGLTLGFTLGYAISFDASILDGRDSSNVDLDGFLIPDDEVRPLGVVIGHGLVWYMSLGLLF